MAKRAGFIYRILNTANDKFYIGGTVQDPRQRWRVHLSLLRNHRHANRFLQNSFLKHGEACFVFDVIAGASDVIAVEQWYLDNLKPYRREIGYNLSRASGAPMLGISHRQSVRRRISKTLTGKKQTQRHVENRLKAFLDNGGHTREHNEEVGRRFSKMNAKTWHNIVSPDGEVYETVVNLEGFCRQHGIDPGNMWKLMKGKLKSCQGWTTLEV